MQLGGDRAVTGVGGATGEGGGGEVVMVGVKLDGESKELLTWALVKVAQPGDRVIALHVLDSSSPIGKSLFLSTPNPAPPPPPGPNLSLLSLLDCCCCFFSFFFFAEGTSSLMSLVNAFDSVLAVYEGFCNLKQVNTVNPSI